MIQKNQNVKHELANKESEILNILISDAKISLRDIAKKIKTSFITVRNKINSLEEDKIIEGYYAKINYEKLGYDINVLIDVRISKGKLFELEKQIAKNPNIYAVYDTTGEYDAVILGRFKTTRQMDTFLKHIQTYDFIYSTKTRLILNTIKEGQIKII